MKPKFWIASLLGLLLCGTAANAHHSFAATFQEGAVITVEGIVTEFSFKNPHTLIYLDVTNADGSVTNWMSEGAAATLLRNQGWGRDTVKPGDRVRIQGDSTRDGSPMVSMHVVELIDAQSGEVTRSLRRQRDEDSPFEPDLLPLHLEDGRPNLTGAWVQLTGSNRVGRTRDLGGTPPYNEVGAAIQAAYDRADDPQIFCEPPGAVRQAGFTPHPVRITQNDDHIVFEWEEFGGRRVVRLGDDLPAPGPKSHLGDSVAHYEDDALIVRTVNLLSNPSRPDGVPTSDQVTTVETYRRADQPELGAVLSTEMVVTDPVYYGDETWVLPNRKRYKAGYEFIENDCRAPLRGRTIEEAVQVADVVIPPPELPPEPEEGPGMLEQLETSSLAIWVAESLWGYPIVLGLHAIGLAIVVGLLIFVDLRLLNVVGDIRLSALFGPMKLAWAGFAINALSGFALFSSQATFIIYSKPFLIKIGMVFIGALLAWHIQRQVTRNAASWENDALPSSIKAAAAISLLCWMGAIIAGRLIAYL